ncbi:hypothetical protein FNF27_07807 [Cafeteria roenbergensis]|nr:hypothetical protein FNF28_06281 [Cafeteria roenbergensis]KAA0164392.1 hypothetical protein FNF27_07807 [Cafeteria roenbergensis]
MAPPPAVVVDESLSPSVAWSAAVNAVLEAHAWDDGFGPVFAAHNRSLFDRVPDAKLRDLLAAARKHQPRAAAALSAIASAISAHPRGNYVSAEYLAGWLWFHELAHTELASPEEAHQRSCCGVLVAPSSNASGARLTVKPNGTGPVIQAVDWYWVTSGFMTAVVPGVASVQENWRYGQVSSESVFAAAARGVTPQVLLFREAFEAAGAQAGGAKAGYESFIEAVAYTELAAPMYAIAAGPGADDGAIVTRDPAGPALPVATHGIARLADAAIGAGAGWRALVQTNYDRWEPDPPSDPRRTAAERLLRSMAPEVGSSSVGAFAAVSAYPVFNEDTAYTAIMCPNDACAEAGLPNLAAFTRQVLLPPDALPLA